ncbi:ribosomal protein S18-alanine N-acetyltransferase [Candidatus Enterovibrio altilux]|uniref:[Ribosomal protein bS18]-alanine N-acetyltransferase n=1 Tax=Candidatus Enterovibrio altilux TaxID=1927128 RepID=A0A291B6T3_9GAMM|nr:ribosomal protein S18-alanine N-acetyltransferase [Candidatus Enterovibrio luxaltus]ATF08703.1 Ribosomal-protein-S18p-alanine acetyltransferase [Candidatus Enterovibrio luxaltus]
MKSKLLPLDIQWINPVISIERVAHTHPWPKTMLEQSPDKLAYNRVLIVDGDVVGYFYSQCVAGEASLLNIAVAPIYQGQGYGKQLLSAFIECTKGANAQEAWLEVRASNVNAIKFYESQGFNESDRRYNYYPTMSGRHEDALIMSYWFEK